MQTKTEEQALSALAAQCSKREYSTGDLELKMRKWGISPDAQERIMTYLLDKKFVDNARFCSAYIHDKVKHDKWGRHKIEQALWAKQVPSEIYSPLLDEVPDEDYLIALRPLIQKKSTSVKGKNAYERNMKLMSYGMSRGFEPRLIRQCLTDVDEWDFPEQ